MKANIKLLVDTILNIDRKPQQEQNQKSVVMTSSYVYNTTNHDK